MSGNTYSTIRTSASRPRTTTSSQSKTETPYSILRSRTATNNSPALGSTTRNSATASENIRLPTIKSATAQLDSTAKTTSTKINSSVKDLKTTARESVQNIEQTVSPVVKSVTEPVTKTAKTITNSVERSVSETIKTIENSPITKRFLGLFIIPLQKHGVSIIAMMVIILGVIIVYKEINKGKPYQEEKKNVIGKIVYETFNTPSYSHVEGFTGKKNEENSCPELNKSTIKNFCKNYDTDKVDDNCLEERCSDLGENCNKSSCCKNKNLCAEGFTLMGGGKLEGASDMEYFSSKK